MSAVPGLSFYSEEDGSDIVVRIEFQDDNVLFAPYGGDDFWLNEADVDRLYSELGAWLKRQRDKRSD